MRFAALLAIACCALGAADKPTVTVFMYSEYIDPEVPAAFEKATGYPLKIEVYEAQEDMIAKLRAGATNQYDVVVATDTVITSMIKLKLVQPLDAKLIPNRANVDKRFLDPAYDQGSAYSLPYQWGTIGLLYDSAKAPKGVTPTWAWAFVEDQMFGPVTLMDEQRSIMGCALKFLGKPMNSRDPKDVQAAADVLIKAKKARQCLGFDGGVGGKNKVLAGQAALAVVYNGDAVRAVSEKPGLAYAVPKEGSNFWVDCLLVTSQAPNLAGAHAFINYVLDAKVAAQISNFNRYATPVAAAMPHITPADAADKAIYPDAATLKTLETIDDLGKDTRLYSDAWTAVKSR